MVELRQRRQQHFVHLAVELSESFQRRLAAAAEDVIHVLQHDLLRLEHRRIGRQPRLQIGKRAAVRRVGEAVAQDDPAGLASSRRQQRRRAVVEDDQVGPHQVDQVGPGVNERFQCRGVAEADVEQHVGEGPGDLEDRPRFAGLVRGLQVAEFGVAQHRRRWKGPAAPGTPRVPGPSTGRRARRN